MNDTCKICNVHSAIPSEFGIFTDEEVNRILRDIYNGKITVENLDLPTYNRIASKLTNGVYEGYGKSLVGVQYNTPDYVMLTSLRENTYIFSAAKTYQQTRHISSLITNDDDTKKSFNEFKKEAAKVFDTYNKNYLYAEYNSAIAQARAASFWQDIELDKGTYNQLKYETVGDGRVRPEHRVLDGIVQPVDSRFWSEYFPPNGWNCRCTAIQTFDEPITKLTKANKPSIEDVPEIFRFNAGKDKIIFSPKHPYFDVAKEDRELAKKNFNLPLP